MARARGRVRNVFWGAFVLDWFKYLQDHDLSSSDYRIMFYLCEKMMTDDNIARVKQKTIAQDLSMDKGNVSKCIKKLCSKQFIVKASDGFMINPNLFYGGNGFQNRENLRENFYNLLSDPARFFMDEDFRRLVEYPQEDDYNKYDAPFNRP
ncbi:hypothetical protein J45TS6_35250 [Paenibacillus sp. J45TS6]|uniref:replication/maintenance protein RepL n=1 Tax=Paenibacillus sp. J45TS6 TaxID=2807196 RepID=UPI001B0702C1|nr:replication/maintenance protein RepL [Paenibacillus sp. J45TS6]GIP45066.1 hypothetical protein J45TS6_35250 [Paenibacillus sp. J45TS6]